MLLSPSPHQTVITLRNAIKKKKLSKKILSKATLSFFTHSTFGHNVNIKCDNDDDDRIAYI